MIKDVKWLQEYYREYSQIIFPESLINKLIEAKEIVLKARENKNKIIFIGNGASNLIASHGALDYINQLGIKTSSVNDAGFITAAANDFGYEKIFERYIHLYAEKGDIIISISSSGKSKNVIDAAKLAKKKKCSVITFTGFDQDNDLKKVGDLNFWVNSHSYNQVESIHNNWLVTICDLITKDEKEKIGNHGLEFDTKNEEND